MENCIITKLTSDNMINIGKDDLPLSILQCLMVFFYNHLYLSKFFMGSWPIFSGYEKSIVVHLDQEILVVDEVPFVVDAEFQKKANTKMDFIV